MAAAIAFALFLFAGLDASATDASTVTAAAPNADLARGTLANGLRVVIVRDPLAPVVATQVTYLVGGYETPQGFPGTAHALEHMMFRGSTGLTGGQLNELTGKMGGDNNAFTTNDATQYIFSAPAAYLDVLLRVEADRMRGALLTDRDWSLEKGAIEQEVSRDISDPSYLAFTRAERILYAGTGYAEDPLGSRPSFDRTTGKMLRDFYDAWYQPSNAILVIVGDIDPHATMARVKELFESLPSHATPTRKPVVSHPFKPQTITATTPSGSGSVQFVFRMPGQMSKDNAAAQVLIDVLNNPRSSLANLAAEGKVLSADAQLQPFSHGGIGVVEAGFAKGAHNESEARAQLDRTIQAMLSDGVPADLVEAAKRSEQAQFEFRKNSAATLATAWSQALAWEGLESPEEAQREIQQVTVDDVNRVAHEFLQPKLRVTVLLKPDLNGKRPPDSSGFGGAESFGGNDKLNMPLPDWAAQALSTLEMPHWTLNPTRTRLANGITLIVQPETISRTVTLVGHIDHDAGLQEPPGHEGVGKLLASLFDYGTSTLDRAAFHKALDDIPANVSGGEEFSLEVPSASFDRGVELLADNELHPALPEHAFQVQQRTLAELVGGEIQTPEYKMVRALRSGLLPPGDPALREATPESVSKLTLADVRKYFGQAYRPDLTTIVVVGDVTPEAAKATVEKYFGAWKAEGPKPRVVPPRVPTNAASYTVVPNAYASQDTVVMGQMLDVDLHDPDRYALQLANDILGGNGFASRLMLDVRVSHGYAYGAASVLKLERSRSVFYVEYGSDPDKVAPVDALVRADIQALQQAPATEDELMNARQYEIRSIPLEVSSVNRIAHALSRWSYRDEPLDEPMVAAKRYLELTPRQVQQAFTLHLKPAHLAQVVQGPDPARH
ncbi:MAG TPA: pitrilysin family protein [Usitatibacter sp.]|nr:pitrilysin family protein [Usitatibacter sp.]